MSKQLLRLLLQLFAQLLNLHPATDDGPPYFRLAPPERARRSELIATVVFCYYLSLFYLYFVLFCYVYIKLHIPYVLCIKDLIQNVGGYSLLLIRSAPPARCSEADEDGGPY